MRLGTLFLKVSVLVAAVMLTAFPAAAQSWFEFVEREELFSVNLPHMPEVEEIVYHSEWGAELPGKLFTASEEHADYRITVVDYSVSDLPPHSPIWDFCGSVDYAAWNIRKRGGEITYDAWTNVDRIAGHMLQITNIDQSRTYVQILSHMERLYILEARAAPGSTPPVHFQQSLRIIDENGDPIRYDKDLRTRFNIEQSQSP